MPDKRDLSELALHELFNELHRQSKKLETQFYLSQPSTKVDVYLFEKVTKEIQVRLEKSAI